MAGPFTDTSATGAEMTGCRLRRATAADARALAACIDAAYAVYADRLSDLPDVSSGVAGKIADRSVWVAELDGELVGGMVLDLRGDVARLENIAVQPDRSGGGIGKALIRRAEAEAASRGQNELRLSTHRDIAENIRIYERLGWRIVEESGNKVHMSKDIEHMA